ncbi:heme o synthase [Jiella sp. LLJ827]|nr:heme o synthase [Jiella sp. LLJ827]
MTLLDTTTPTTTGGTISLAEPRDFITLLKPRVMSLVVLTAVAGLVVSPGALHPTLAVISILAIAVGAGAAGALNMWYDADIDAVMTRTAKRPVPMGRVSPEAALSFGLILSILSVMLLGLASNWFAAAFLAFTIFFYAVIYTMGLKRSTPQNIVIGGAAGAFPPMIGWAAVTGDASVNSFILFLIIFLWTPPHFWALALFKLRDYGDAGVPMLPNVAGERSTKLQIFAYSVVLAPVAVLPWILGFAGVAYGAVATVLGLNFVRHAWAVLNMADGDERMIPAKKLFGFSILYLFGLFAMLIVDAAVAPLLGLGA